MFSIGRVPLDKSEGSVKSKVVLGSAWAPLVLPERVEDQDSGTSRCNHFSVVILLPRIVPPTIDSA